MCNKSEQMLVTETKHVGYPAEEQRTNIATVNCLFAFDAGIRACVQDSAIQDHPEARASVLDSLSKIDVLIRSEPKARILRQNLLCSRTGKARPKLGRLLMKFFSSFAKELA
jgi:hypothetical protein